MIPKLHPLAKTAIELRRAINRLVIFQEQNPKDSEVEDGTVSKTIEELKETRRHIPKQFWDTDLL